MDLFILSVAVILNLLLALFVLYRNYKSATNILFFLFTVDIALWSLANYFSRSTMDISFVLFWVRAVMFLAVPQAVLFFLLIHTFPKPRIVLSYSKLVFVLVTSLIVMGITVSPYLFPSVSLVSGSPVPNSGPGIVPFILVAIGAVVAGLITLIKKYLKAKSIAKEQLKYILLGVCIFFVCTIIFNLILPVFFRTSFLVVFSPLYTFVFVGCIAYAIIKHRLLDIKIVVARSIAFTLLLFVLAIIYLGGFLGVGTYLLGQKIDGVSLLLSTLLALGLILSFQTIRGLIEQTTDTIFYRGEYRSADLLGKLSKIMSSTLLLSSLTEEILKELLEKMKISHADILLIREGKIIWVKEGGAIQNNQVFKEEDLADLITKTVREHGENLLIFDELGDDSKKTIMREHNISVLLPLTVENEIIGGILFGEKESGDLYSSQDIEVLKILAPEIAVAVRNALSYEEIKRFNVTLKEEVDRATADLQKANEHLKQLDHLKDEFVSLASHELRTPMTVVKSYLWMVLQDKKGKLNKQQKLYLERAATASDGLINLVNDMLNVSRIESGRFSIEKQKIDIKELVGTTVKELTPEAEKRGLHLSFHLESKDIPTFSLDPERIKQVLINLIGNSLKFTPKNGSISVALSKSDSHVVVQIKDNGVGISKENLAKLFQKFGLLRESYQKSDTQGTGLGLYICKSIVELHGGKIWAESEGEGKGATFTFSLPIK